MAVIVFDNTGKRLYETGVDKGVLYPLNSGTGLYDNGVPWNGLTTVTEKPAGADSNPQFADNIKYLNLLSAETFGATVEAFTYPDEFALCDGTLAPAAGVNVGQQPRQTFGMSFRTKVGNDVSANAGYKLHLCYGLLASPSEKAFATINDSPAATGFSWDVNSSPASVSGLAPTSLIVVDSTKVLPAPLASLEQFLYGTAGTNPSLPPPDSVIALFVGSITLITLTPATFDGAHTITIPSQSGVTYYLDGVVQTSGAKLLTTGQSKIVTAVPNAGFVFNTPVVTSWLFKFVS
jgi:hypothetical protein